MARRGKWEDQFTSNLGTRWTDPITARRVPVSKGRRMGSKREWGKGKAKSKGIALLYTVTYFVYIMNACNV
jgi:hypothetical protein